MKNNVCMVVYAGCCKLQSAHINTIKKNGLLGHLAPDHVASGQIKPLLGLGLVLISPLLRPELLDGDVGAGLDILAKMLVVKSHCGGLHADHNLSELLEALYIPVGIVVEPIKLNISTDCFMVMLMRSLAAVTGLLQISGR